MKKKIVVFLLLSFIFALTVCTAKPTKQQSASPVITVQPTESPTAVSNSENIPFSTAQNENETVTEKDDTNIVDTETSYIGNIKTKKFHLPACHTLPAEKNRTILSSRDEAISVGYSPCGNCQP